MQPTPERLIADDASLSLLQKILLTTDGTVTQLLEIYTGERIRVEKIEHTLVKGGPAPLGVAADEPVLSREILLRGADRPYMYAHSWLVPSRLPQGMQNAMLQTDTPIGQLWRAAKLETYREIVDYRREPEDPAARLFPERSELLSRSYVIRTGGAPMGLITEKFPATLFGRGFSHP
ncbi:chorismate-pyruvate lyase [Povalibacter uvarum]|uniref:Chorismate-pyruvate lyase n=1 Tax=Povalibacter uvarum TaxID=732238 RepID=A0A841HJK7_9GAMM|nr:chorismate pyruvate-lyase family protein [Povalibacter uvarum]MBB6093401.1 chorismate-pyruvate lyase [Povalibacter uvarum]